MPSFAIVTGTFVVLVAIFAGYLYLFGLSPEVKRELEEKALKTMGENKASYLAKDAIGNIPDEDQKEFKDIKNTLGNAGGGALQNPLGKLAGDTADDASRDFTGP